MDKQAIVVNRLTYDYPGSDDSPNVQVFEGLDLEIKEGSFVAILGHNGCGKSTLAKHFNAVLLPTGGKVYVYDYDTSNDDRLIDIRRTVGMVFQNPDNQIVSNVVEEDVAFAPENLGVEPSEIRKRVDDALKQVGMFQYRDHAPHMLSGGQKQRIAIAGVIAMSPKCIVLDEPTAMLDPQGRRDVLDAISALNRTNGMTVVLITHHMPEAALADRVIVMSDGGVVADGAPEQVFTNVDLLRSVGLTVPDTTMLLHELQERGWDICTDLLSVDKCAQAIYDYLSGDN